MRALNISVGMHLGVLLQRMAGVKTGQVIVGDYCKPEPHRNGCTWVGRVWLQQHFPAEYAEGLLNGTREVEITQRKTLLLLSQIPKPGDTRLLIKQLEADVAFQTLALQQLFRDEH